MPYENAEAYNQTLTEVLQGEKAHLINQFCQSFIATFNNDTQAAKMITTGKLEMTHSKKEEAVQLGVAGGFDVASLFPIPTGVLGKVTEKAISALFKGIRKKGYKKVSGLGSHMTQVELISEALTLGLTIHYKNELLDEDTASDPKKWGNQAAKRLLSSLKSNSKKSLKLEPQATLVQQLKSLLEWCVKKDYIREEPEPIQADSQGFTNDDYLTLLTLASAELLGLPRDHFVEAQKTAAKANELLAKIESMEQALEAFKAKLKHKLAQAKESERATTLVNILEKDVTLEGEIETNVACFVDVVFEYMQGLSAEECKSLQAQFNTTLQHTSERHDAFLEALKERNIIVNVTAPGSNIPKGARLTTNIGGYQAPVIRPVPPAQTSSPPVTYHSPSHEEDTSNTTTPTPIPGEL